MTVDADLLPESLALDAAEYAEAYLQRHSAGQANPEDLAVLVQFLTGEMLHAFCAVIHRALAGVRLG